MATLLYQTSLPYWLFALALLKLAPVQAALMGEPMLEPVDVPGKRVVTVSFQHSGSEPEHVAEHETHTEEFELVAPYLETYLGPHLGVTQTQAPDAGALLQRSESHRALDLRYCW